MPSRPLTPFRQTAQARRLAALRARRRTAWRRLAGVVGAILLIVSAGAIVVGRAGVAIVILVLMSGPLIYGGWGVPMPTIKAGGIRLGLKPRPGRKRPGWKVRRPR
jgi:hypothetical protein